MTYLDTIRAMTVGSFRDREAERIRAVVRGTGRFDFARHLAYHRLFRKEAA